MYIHFIVSAFLPIVHYILHLVNWLCSDSVIFQIRVFFSPRCPRSHMHYLNHARFRRYVSSYPVVNSIYRAMFFIPHYCISSRISFVAHLFHRSWCQSFSISICRSFPNCSRSIFLRSMFHYSRAHMFVIQCFSPHSLIYWSQNLCTQLVLLLPLSRPIPSLVFPRTFSTSGRTSMLQSLEASECIGGIRKAITIRFRCESELIPMFAYLGFVIP